jgi:hypothetical protein
MGRHVFHCNAALRMNLMIDHKARQYTSDKGV